MVKAEQFQRLGLTSAGEEKTPGVEGPLQPAQEVAPADQGDAARHGEDARDPAASPAGALETSARSARRATGDPGDVQRHRRERWAAEGAEKTGPLTQTSGPEHEEDPRRHGAHPRRSASCAGACRASTPRAGFSARAGWAGASHRSIREGGFGNNPIFVESHTTINLDGQQVAIGRHQAAAEGSGVETRGRSVARTALAASRWRSPTRPAQGGC